MNNILKDAIEGYVMANIAYFHEARIEKLKTLKLENLLKRKNPYLYKAKDLNTPQAVIESLASAFMSSAEETMFEDWLEQLAIHVAEIMFNGHKSSAEGIDLEMDKEGVHYFVSIKSGPNWSNSSSLKKLCENFVKARRIYTTSGNKRRCECIEGCCYGTDFAPLKTDGHYKLCGKLFWEVISGDANLYTEIIKPLGVDATRMNQEYKAEYDRMITRFSLDFGNMYADSEGNLLWGKILELNSGYPDDFSFRIL